MQLPKLKFAEKARDFSLTSPFNQGYETRAEWQNSEGGHQRH